MVKFFGFILVLLSAAFTWAQTSSDQQWIGKYAHANDFGKEYFMLEIYRDGQTIKGKYKETVTAQTTNKFSLTVSIKGNVASFLLADCLPLSKAEEEDAGRNSCGETGGYKSGDLILKLRRTVRGNKVTFTTVGGKLTTAGFAGEVDFARTKKFLGTF